MALGGPEIFIVLLVWLVLIAVAGVVLYLIIRLGVKHGLRSYYAAATQRPGPDSQDDQR
ncbi:hypothetical protein [Arthrobacter sedimenti]|uniref:hypothetical protein n=1 Tax=Arthrobacter sedimenti TaxID=2694931 RepID=UPI00142242D1|nr:hypothetical protein [Arthrobacter sedimenti]